jgi:hypothetical protein
MELDFPDIFDRHTDEIERFTLFVEQLEAAVESVKSGRLALERIALVALDNLAEMLLHEFLELTFYRSDESCILPGPKFSQSRRRKIDNDFGRKVSLAMQPQLGFLTYPGPLLDELDASIFRVAHRYRNDLYHAGRHNGALIGPLVQLYAEAVGRSFVRSNPEGVSMGGGIEKALARLDHFDFRDDPTRNVFVPSEAATRIVANLCSFAPLSVADLAEGLAGDIRDRCDVLDGDLAGLARDGLSSEQVEALCESVQLWAAHRGDQELLDLAERYRDLMMNHELPTDDARIGALEAVKRAQNDRMQELERDFVFPLHLGDIRKVKETTRAVRGATSVPSVIVRYNGLDERLDQLERAVGWMLIEWDRVVTFEEDVRRGK